MGKRTPPEHIRRNLRREVGFGCPIEECRSPFLSYHHFDPTWRQGHKHNEAGMIALCLAHHAMADRVAWTLDDLKKMKKIKPCSPVKGRISWNLENCILIAGQNYFLGKNVSLRILGYNVFNLHQNEDGMLVIDSLLWDNSGNVILEIKENDILTDISTLGDLKCTASGDNIKVESKCRGTFLEIRMNRVDMDIIMNNLPASLANDKLKDHVCALFKTRIVDGEIPIVLLKARIVSNKFEVEIRDPDIKMDFRKLGYDLVSFSGRLFNNGALNIVFENKKHEQKEFIHLGRP